MYPKLENAEIHIAPYRNYLSYNIDPAEFDELGLLLRTLAQPVGYKVFENNTVSEKFHFENTEQLITETIKLIDLFDQELLDHLDNKLKK